MKAMLLVLLLSVPGWLTAQEYNARLEWAQQLELGALISGVLAEVRVQPGQQVKRGDLLAALDDRGAEARLQHVKALSKKGEIMFAEALREEERARELYDRGLLSEHELQEARLGRLDAEARKFQIMEEETRARLYLEYSKITAPFDGEILEVNAWAGQPVRNSCSIQPLLILGKKGELRFHLKGAGNPPAISEVEVRVDSQWLKATQVQVEAGENGHWTLSASVEHSRLRAGQVVEVRVK